MEAPCTTSQTHAAWGTPPSPGLGGILTQGAEMQSAYSCTQTRASRKGLAGPHFPVSAPSAGAASPAASTSVAAKLRLQRKRPPRPQAFLRFVACMRNSPLAQSTPVVLHRAHQDRLDFA